MSFFLSSPPQPTHQNSYYQQSFLTPQTHRTNLFPQSYSFQPKSPSPLRPSWNAGNVMRPQPQPQSQSLNTKDSNQNIWDENSLQQENTGTTGKDIQVANSSFSSTSTTTPSTNLFTSPSTPQDSSQPQPSTRNPFTYQSASNSLKPTTQISTRIRQNRDTRRSLFLDRLRTSRRDARDNSIIERFEKEEYWGERRRREERLAREAERWNEDGEGEEELMVMEEGEESGGMSPPEDEGEWFGEQSGMSEDGGGGVEGVFTVGEGMRRDDDEFMDTEFDFEDEDVEEAFLAVLSQQGSGQIMDL